ncbi:hypothetical protein [Streptomyces sp. B93]|uniref:hypothetical protein n=1 Tax=Streptomyces sp. B93 TaxID=2824875 RepID=UPI001B394090|nr:hypothetical protein [Streptomyces sp. B93]MBQ1089646.1 hypothetical protein [Streptomyces sp. B93]
MGSREEAKTPWEELFRLVTEMATVANLESCPTWLALVPISRAPANSSTYDKARALRRIFLEVVDAAYETHKQTPTDNLACTILAAGALMGLVVDDPKRALVSPSQSRRGPADLKSIRQGVAGAWVGGVDERTVRNHWKTYIENFGQATHDYLEELTSQEEQSRQQVEPQKALPDFKGSEAIKHSDSRIQPSLALDGSLPIETVASEQNLTSPISVDDHSDSSSSEPIQTRDRTQPSVDSDDRKQPQPANPRTVFLSILSAVALIITTIVGAYKWISSDAGESPEPGPVAQPADPSSLPVKVVNMVDIKPAPVGSFVLAENLDFSDEELAEFNTNVYAQTERHSSWFKEHQAIPVDSRAYNPRATITLIGNLQEEIRITDMKVIKDCRPPLDGTFFSPFDPEGTTSPGPKIPRIAFNLDEGDPAPQDANKEPRGNGESYFGSRTITLRYGESETLGLGFFSQQYFCKFTLRLFVATSKGSVYQDIDASGENRDLKSTTTPFSLTALLSGDSKKWHLGGWKNVYARFDWRDDRGKFHREWVRVSPECGLPSELAPYEELFCLDE